MNLKGTAFLALWNGVAPGQIEAYQDWHGVEHVPERLTVPGMLAAWRYQADDGDEPAFFTLYDLASIEVLQSPAYQRLINEPSPASTRMRPHLTHFTRIVCRVAASRPSPDAGFVMPLVTETIVPPLPDPRCALRHGIIAADAPGHPLARPEPRTGSVLLLDADDTALMRAEASRLVGAAAAAARAFRLIGTFLPVA